MFLIFLVCLLPLIGPPPDHREPPRLTAARPGFCSRPSGAWLGQPLGKAVYPGDPKGVLWLSGDLILAARPNRFNRGNCFQWKGCLGETVGNMWVDSPDFCGPLGGKSWKGRNGRCLDLMDAPWEDDPAKYPPPGNRPGPG